MLHRKASFSMGVKAASYGHHQATDQRGNMGGVKAVVHPGGPGRQQAVPPHGEEHPGLGQKQNVEHAGDAPQGPHGHQAGYPVEPHPVKNGGKRSLAR